MPPVPLLSGESDATLQHMLSIPLHDGGFMCDGPERFRATQPSLSTLQEWRTQSGMKPMGHPQRCAVVGSSFSLLKAWGGPEIDSADWVIRVNNAPAPAHQAGRLGSKTSLTLNVFPELYFLNASRHLRGRLRPPAPTVDGARVLYYCHTPWVSRCWDNAAVDREQRLSPRFVAHVSR